MRTITFLEPTGAADPYALRRQSNAIVETIIEKKIRLYMEN
ncbi:MAG: glycine--tRNA ligase subunit beta [Promethearchaeota archaeon]